MPHSNEQLPENDSGKSRIAISPAEESRMWRKVDLRLIPVVTLLYIFSNLDRGNIANARLLGLEDQLNLVGSQFNVVLVSFNGILYRTVYFITYCLFEVPSNLLLKKLRPSRWLPGITVTFGIISICTGFVRSYKQLLVCRLLLGVAEAGILPGVIYYFTLWYPRHKLQIRIGMYIAANTIAGAFSGLIAYAIGFMSGTRGLLGWSWVFILDGTATVLFGLFAFTVMVDYPSTVTFLTPEEKAFIVAAKQQDITPFGEDETFHRKYIWQAVSDWKVWISIPMTIGISISCMFAFNFIRIGYLLCMELCLAFSIMLFLPTIINSFGFSVPVSQILTVPPYFVATLFIIASSYYSDKLKIRFPFICAGLIMLLIGFSINLSDGSVGVRYFGIFFCASGAYVAYPGAVAWLGNNLTGQYKRGVGLAIQITMGNIGGAIASNIFRTKDEPRFELGHALTLTFVGLSLVSVPIAVILYRRANAAKEKELALGYQYDEATLRDMGDKAPGFRYTL